MKDNSDDSTSSGSENYKRQILIVEDDPNLRTLLVTILSEEGYRPISCGDGFMALDLLYSRRFDLVLLDIGLPNISGIEICRRMRCDPGNLETPLIILSGRSQEVDIVYGLGAGADDYMVKPVKPKELVARIHLRIKKDSRSKNNRNFIFPEESKTPFGQIRLMRDLSKVYQNGEDLCLSQAEYRIFEALFDAQGHTLGRDLLIQALSPGAAKVAERNIDTHVRAIRQKLGSARDIVQTVHGFGYRFLSLRHRVEL